MEDPLIDENNKGVMVEDNKLTKLELIEKEIKKRTNQFCKIKYYNPSSKSYSTINGFTSDANDKQKHITNISKFN
jgi:hypothetical protein